MEAIGEDRARRLVAGAVIVLLGALYVAAVAWESHAQWLIDHPSAANLERGVRLHPNNTTLWTNYAIHWLFEDAGKARDAYLRSARLSPMEPANWEGLGTAYLQLGDQEKAEAALRANATATPGSPQAAWRLANLLLVRGREREAIPYLRDAARLQQEMRTAVFDLGWKIIGSPAQILRDLVPPGVEVRSDYLRFLIERHKLSDAEEVWNDLRRNRDPIVSAMSLQYLNALVAAGMSTEATRVWEHTLEYEGRPSAKPPGDILTNGDFEFDTSNAGLDWTTAPGDGYEISLDNFTVQNGSRSLRVAFDGSTNPEFNAVYQVAPVQPNSGYSLRGFMRTENIGTDNGVRMCVTGEVPAGDALQRCSDSLLGDNPWTAVQLDFRTGPGTKFVRIGLRRFQSAKSTNLLQGRVWIDHCSLRPAGSPPPQD